jgi:antagonist of KipI
VTAAFEVLEPGVFATVQDRGRFGLQRQGVGTAGAMDRFALEVGNLLVGNPRGAAAIEVGLGGLRLRAFEDRVVAICGGDLGAGLPLWKSLRVRKDDEIRFRSPVRGAWAVLAVAGGIEAEELLGSRSTSVRERIGRALAKGDLLRAGEPGRSSREGRALVEGAVPVLADPVEARVVMGPEPFPEESVRAFLEGPFEVTPQSNRMGYRLRGPALRGAAADLLSEGVAPGTVQVTADGQPIVLMADRQTTGGYARIATVISTDLGALAQARPGKSVRFREVSVDEAQETAVRRENLLATLQEGCGVGR